MDLFGRLLDLSLENNAFPATLMDLFQKNSSRLIKLIVTTRPNLSWHYGKVLMVWRDPSFHVPPHSIISLFISIIITY